jgi:solute carrier family 41
MNLSARLGTAANVGELDEPKQRRSMILGNLALLQVQAMVVSFVAACIAILLGLFISRQPEGAPIAAQPSSNSVAPSLLIRDLLLRKPIPHPHPEAKHRTDLATYVVFLC